jgi:integrase
LHGGSTLADTVFHRGGEPIKSFGGAWKKATASAGLSRVLFHDLRRSGVRELRRSGNEEKVCMAISGHKTRATFDRYNIVDDDDVARAVERRLEYQSRETGSEDGIVRREDRERRGESA